MKAIWGLGLTYVAFGLFSYGRYLENDLGELFKAALRGAEHHPGLYWFIAALVAAIVGAVLVIHTAITYTKKKKWQT